MARKPEPKKTAPRGRRAAGADERAAAAAAPAAEARVGEPARPHHRRDDGAGGRARLGRHRHPRNRGGGGRDAGGAARRSSLEGRRARRPSPGGSTGSCSTAPAMTLPTRPARERLFDVLMRRLDALAPYKAGLRRQRPDVRARPAVAGRAEPARAELDALHARGRRHRHDGSDGRAEGAGRGAAVGAGCSTPGSDDDDPGLARTMAVLDKELRRAGQFVGGLNDLCRIAAPFRAVFDRAAEGGRRFRERQRSRREPDGDDDYAEAVSIAEARRTGASMTGTTAAGGARSPSTIS